MITRPLWSCLSFYASGTNKRSEYIERVVPEDTDVASYVSTIRTDDYGRIPV